MQWYHLNFCINSLLFWTRFCRTQFKAKGFKNFCKVFFDCTYHNYRTISPAEGICRHFQDSIKKSQTDSNPLTISYNILWVYRVTPNPSTNTGLSPVELMFAWKITSVFDKLLPKGLKKTKHQKKKKIQNTVSKEKKFERV